jgi:hypothetical protein
MGLFDNLNNTKPQDSRFRKLEDGEYTVEIRECLSKESGMTEGVNLYIVEWTVVTSTNPNFKAGDETSWTQNMSKKGAKETLANFMVSALGYDYTAEKDVVDKEILPSLGQFAQASVNPGILRKHIVKVTVKTKDTKSRDEQGKPFKFAAHYFSKAGSPAEQKARRA